MDQNSKKFRILYIEDEPFHMEYTIASIIDAGFEVEIVDNVEEVPDRLDNSKFDIILLDMMMDCPSEIFTIAETQSGFLTGKKIYEKYISKLSPVRPVIVLTALNLKTNIGHEVKNFFKSKDIPILEKASDDEKLVNKLKDITNKELEKE